MDFSKSEVPTLHTNQNQRNNAKGAPGLAFETWDPRNPYLMDTRDVTTGTQTRQNLPSPSQTVHQRPALPLVIPRDLQFRGPLVEMFSRAFAG